MFTNLFRLNFDFLFYLSIFYSIYIIYKKWINLSFLLKEKSPVLYDNNWLLKGLFHIIFIFIVICIYYISKNFLGIDNINNNEYKVIKLTLGFFISILVLFINIKEKGIKSWITKFSFFSLSFLILYIYILFDNDEWGIFINEKLNNYLITFTFWICILISFFSYDYLYLFDNNINILKFKLFKQIKVELLNKPNLMINESSSDKDNPINIFNKSEKIKDSDSSSIMSHDSTLSTGHIAILEASQVLAESSEVFARDWKESKILTEEDDRKKLLDKIIDLPEHKVFQYMQSRYFWEQDIILHGYIRKRNIPPVPRDQLINLSCAAFDETMSDKTERDKFWNRVKSFLKEPIKDKDRDRDRVIRLRKELFSVYMKGEEEAIVSADRKNAKPLQVDGRKFKKGGLMAVYQDRKLDAEATIQQQELRDIKKGNKEVKRIIPSLGRLSIFEILNQSVESIINDFRKLKIDSSKLDNSNKNINTNFQYTQSITDDNNYNYINNNDNNNNNNISSNFNSLESDEKNVSGNSVLIKGENNEVNKKRRIN